jgi:hypothetical protein
MEPFSQLAIEVPSGEAKKSFLIRLLKATDGLGDVPTDRTPTTVRQEWSIPVTGFAAVMAGRAVNSAASPLH